MSNLTKYIIKVQIHGLVETVKYNDQIGTVVQIKIEEETLVVQLDSGIYIEVSQKNVKIVDEILTLVGTKSQ